MDSLAITYKIESGDQRVITPIVVQQAIKFCKYFNLGEIQFSARALWDTGSTGCCINRRLADSLGLKNIGTQVIFGSRGLHETPTCMLDIILSDGVLVENITVAGVESSSSFDFIIGMNIIRHGDFALTNDNGKTVMSFRLPSANMPVDFAKV
jgi:hypothetical protein